MEKRLYRSRENKVVSGVCGGIAEYFEVDATLIRLLWAVTILFAGTGILAYILCIIIIPESPVEVRSNEADSTDETEDINEENEIKREKKVVKENKNGTYIIGLAFIGIGMLFITRRILWWFNINFAWDLFFPVLFVFFGVYLIAKKRG
ncbi:MAG: PspC domain-containing protein [Clostridiales bacterium]|nr:PspC domain-containing protein [Clostridiales bacterium]